MWSLSGSAHGLAISAALWGTVLGALFGSYPTAKFGRKLTLLFNGVLFLVGALGSAVAWDVYSFFIFRFIGGIGIGISTIAAPLFIAEISPASDRGKLTGLFQFNIVLGILMAFLSNFIILELTPEALAWRFMLGIQVIPCAIYTFLCCYLPESPRWLIVEKNDLVKGKHVFGLINPSMTESQLDNLVNEVKESAKAEIQSKTLKSKFFCRKLLYPILFAFLIAAFNQLSGINIILYFAPRLLALAGMEDPLAASISLGITNFIATFIGIRLIDKLGRKTLLIIGCIGYIISLSVCTYSFFHYSELKVVSSAIDTVNSANHLIDIQKGTAYFTIEDAKNANKAYETAKENLYKVTTASNYIVDSESLVGNDIEKVKTVALDIKAQATNNLGSVSSIVLVCMITFIASHAIGSGTIIWVFISEIFPNSVRAKGQSLGSFTHWIFAAGLTLFFPIAISSFDAGFIFGFFAFMMVLQLIWCVFMMKETKGKTLETIAREMQI